MKIGVLESQKHQRKEQLEEQVNEWQKEVRAGQANQTIDHRSRLSVVSQQTPDTDPVVV